MRVEDPSKVLVVGRVVVVAVAERLVELVETFVVVVGKIDSYCGYCCCCYCDRYYYCCQRY